MNSYSTTRYAFSRKRSMVWQEICRYLNRRYILPTDRVLELGCGYGDFIGNIRAANKTCIDVAAEMADHLAQYPGVSFHLGAANSILPTLPDNSFDTVFCSNYFEHFAHEDIARQLVETSRILVPDGKLIVIQPNYRLCAASYFDDYTHRSVFSDVSFPDFLAVHGFSTVLCKPRLLPFSFKTRLPINRHLVRLYLHSPIKPMAGQFLVIAKNSRKLYVEE